MKIELSSEQRETLLFLTTNMAAVTLHVNQQYINSKFPKVTTLVLSELAALLGSLLSGNRYFGWSYF